MMSVIKFVVSKEDELYHHLFCVVGISLVSDVTEQWLQKRYLKKFNPFKICNQTFLMETGCEWLYR